ncbi:MAG: STAS/SEC14 domain-containing protein [Gammaproteobacteria bacterium]|nr:STAS/SEC14 domain-containing protein [Gammaproteobacteria bacterium]
MSFKIIETDDDVICVRLSGQMRFADQQALQARARALIDQGKEVRVLVYASDFQGWERTDNWSDVGFLMEHGDDIVKMAIIGDERWKDDVFLFVGKGLRTTQIEFFAANRGSEAEHWVRA